MDLLQLAGGRDYVFPLAYSISPDMQTAAASIVSAVEEAAIERLTGELMAEMCVTRDMFTLMEGERPRGPSDGAETWDEGFEGKALPVFEKFAARAGVPQKWIIDTLAGAIRDDADLIESHCRDTAYEMVETLLKGRTTVNKKLSFIGITVADIAEGWKLLAAGKSVDTPPKRYDFVDADEAAPARLYTPEDTTDKAVIHVAQEMPAVPSAPVVMTVGAPAALPKKRRKRDATASHILPAMIFTALKAVGVPDKEVADAIGLPRSTYNRISSGLAVEIGLTDEQANLFVAFAARKREALQTVLETLGMYGLGVA